MLSTQRPVRALSYCLLFAIGLGLPLLLLLLIGGATAHAGTQCVEPTGAGGCYTTIQAAIDAAAAGDTIAIAAGTYAENLTTARSLTLVGAGRSATILDGSSAGSVLRGNTGTNLTLSNLTIQNGYVLNNQGGGIFTSGAVTLTSVDVLTNAASAEGGGVYAYAGLVLSDTRFVSNTAYILGTGGTGGASGGGACTMGPITVTNSLFQQNVAKGTGNGGGVYAAGAGVLSSSLFLTNTSFRGGGAWVQGSARVEGGLFTANATTGGVGGGFGAWGTTTVSGTQFLTNTSFGPGGGASINATGWITNSTFWGNTCTDAATCKGGGLVMAGGEITASQFAGNSAVTYGGGVSSGGAMTVTNSLFEANTCTGSTCRGGGLSSTGLVAITNTNFLSNTAGPGAGTQAGGLLLNVGGYLAGGIIQGNTAADGGGISTSGSTTITGTQLLGNHTTGTSNGGGAIYVPNTAGITLELTNVEARDNSSAASGGAIYSTKPLTVSGGSYTGNVSSINGGAIRVSDALRLDHAQIAGNTAGANGGGIYAGAQPIRITNALLLRNTAAGTGAGLYRSNATGTLELVNTTIAASGVITGSAIAIGNGTALISNTLIAAYPTGITRSGGTVVEDYNLFAGVTTAKSGTITSGGHSQTAADAKFVDAAADNYHLLDGSPAAGNGYNYGIAVDFDGTTRPDPPSIGAFEGVALPAGLSLAKRVTPASAVGFQAEAVFTVTLANTGALAESGVVLTDTLPAGASFSRWIAQPAGVVQAGAAITWTGAIAAGDAITLSFAATNTASGGAVITNTAYYSGASGTGNAAAAYTATADCYAATSGNWSVVFAACASNPGAKKVIPTGSTVTLDGDVTLAGDLLVQGTLVPNGRTVTLTGAAAQTLTGNPLTFYQLVVNKTARTDTVTISGKLKVTRKLTITSGRLISASDYEDVEIQPNGILSLTNPISIGGHFTNTGELVTNGQRVTFDGSVENPGKEQWLYSDGIMIFDDLMVMTGTTLVEVYASDNILINGTLTNYGTIRKHQDVSGIGAYSFGLAGNYHDDNLAIDVITASTLAGLTVDRVDATPADAPAGQTTAIYWTITPTGTGYTANLTLPQAGLTDPLACRAVTTGVWDCGRDSFTPTHVVRNGVTGFSPWAVWAQVPTTTTLTSSANPAVYGATVTFTATVQPSTALGSVQFYANGAALGTAQAIAGGVATYTSTMHVLGTHTVTATTTITGGPYVGSVAAELAQQVNRAGTAVVVTSSPNPADPGQTVTITATVVVSAPGSGTPTGVVTFTVDSTAVATASLISGTATYTTASLAYGDHTVAVAYDGDANFVGSNGSLLNGQTVNKLAATVGVTASPNPSVIGQPVTFTATVTGTSAGAAVPSGLVLFVVDNSPVLTPTLDAGGVATLRLATLSAGSHTVTVYYSGDATYRSGAAPEHTQVVQPLPLAVNDAAGTLQDEAVTIRVLANDLDPAGDGLMVSAITRQPANGAVAVSPDAQSVVYTPTAGFAGLDSFTYLAQDANGHTDDALVAVVVTARQQHGTAPQVAPVNLTVDSSAVFTSPQAQVDALLPAGFISTTLGEKDIFFLAYTPVLTPTEKVNQAPVGFKFGNFEFDLTAYLNNVPEHGVQFAVPVTVSITYDPALVSHVQEQTLKVYYWNGTAWVDDGITVIARDVYAHTITLAITHLSDFAFFAAAPTAEEPIPEPDALFKVYLPAVSRQD